MPKNTASSVVGGSSGLKLLAVLALAAAVGGIGRPAVAASYELHGLKYREIGPAVSGGRTPAVAGSDADPNLYYAGGADGGVFKSEDGGITWRAVFDRQPAAAIGAIAIAPSDPAQVWVGTGEANPRNDVQRGDGVWRSPDGGRTWRHLGLDDAGSIAAISIDPHDPRRVVVAALGQVFRANTTRGIYTTRDGGAHWTHALYLGPSIGASDVVRSPADPQTLFAGMYPVRRLPWDLISGGLGGGLFRSADGGMSWTKIAGQGLPAGPTGRIGLAAGTKARVYAIIQSKAGDIWRSDDSGRHWTLMPHSYLVGARPFYFSRLAVDPSNADRVMSFGLQLGLSEDGARSFKHISGNAGWDYHELWWSHDGRRIIVGGDEGVTMSPDGGRSWRQPYQLPFAQVYHVGYDDSRPNYHVCVGLQDNSSWCGAANGDSGLGVLDRDWLITGTGDGMWTLYDPLDPQLVWSTSTNSGTGQVYLWDSRTQQLADVSPDAEVSGLTYAADLRHRFNWISPLAFTHASTVLVGGERVFESADRGRHWQIISPDLTRNERSHQQIPGGPVNADMSGAEISDTLLDLTVSPLNGDVIWAGSDDGLVHVTRDGGAHWRDVTPRQMPHWGRVPCIDASTFEPGTAFVVADNHMLGDERPYAYATTDFGATWSPIAGDLPADAFLRSIRQDRKNPRLLYAGAQRSVWASWDAGAHWKSLRLNMPASAVYDLALQPNRNDLIVGTHGRGVWVLDDLTAVQQLDSVAPNSPRLFPLRDAYRWWQWAPINAFDNGSLPADTYAGTNAHYGALITYWLPSNARNAVAVDVLDAQGTVIRHLKGKTAPHEPGMNRTSWDLREDGPTKWTGTFKDNRGPSEGPDVVPGVYTIRLRSGGWHREQHVTIKPDPRADDDPQAEQRRHDFLARLYSDVGSIDAMLNAVDRRLQTSSAAQRRGLLAFRARLTNDERAVEDITRPVRLRERLLDLIYRVQGNSFQAPTPADEAEATRLQQAFERLAPLSKALP